MQFKTILNHVEKQPGFVYGQAKIRKVGKRAGVHVRLHPRKGCKPRCSGCGKPRPAYDKLAERTFRYLPLFATLAVFFVYQPRRCDCPRCGVKVEMVPWATGKSPITHSLGWWLASWAKELSWQQVARRFHVSWNVVYDAVAMAVQWGLAHRSLDNIVAIGVEDRKSTRLNSSH